MHKNKIFIENSDQVLQHTRNPYFLPKISPTAEMEKIQQVSHETLQGKNKLNLFLENLTKHSNAPKTMFPLTNLTKCGYAKTITKKPRQMRESAESSKTMIVENPRQTLQCTNVQEMNASSARNFQFVEPFCAVQH